MACHGVAHLQALQPPPLQGQPLPPQRRPQGQLPLLGGGEVIYFGRDFVIIHSSLVFLLIIDFKDMVLDTTGVYSQVLLL